MKNIATIIIVLLFISCKKENNFLSEKFQPINYTIKNNYIDSVGKKIIPNSDYKYWQYSSYYQPFGGETKHTILNEGGDQTVKNKINTVFKPSQNTGFFTGGHPSYRCNYAITIDNDNIVRFIETEEEFKSFLGSIDNIEEALLLAKTYGYHLDDDIRGSEYRKVKNGFELHLMKFHQYPTSKESVEITILKDGSIKTKSLGIYCKGFDCY